MSAAPWTKEELTAWMLEAGVGTYDAIGYFEFLDAVTNMYYQKCLNAGVLPSITDFTDAIRNALETLK